MSNNAISNNGAAIINCVYVPPCEFQILYYVYLCELENNNNKNRYFRVSQIVEKNKENKPASVRTLLIRLKTKQLIVNKDGIYNKRAAVLFSLSSESRLFFKNIDPELLSYANINNNSR
jgi:hypothetical protein